jgi:hypothetical protein
MASMVALPSSLATGRVGRTARGIMGRTELWERRGWRWEEDIAARIHAGDQPYIDQTRTGFPVHERRSGTAR